MIVFWVIPLVLSILQAALGAPGPQDEGGLRFSDRRRDPEDSDYRARRPQNSGGGSNIENIFKIPIAVIKGTSAAAQAFYPQNTETINRIFDIPVTTLDAVGNYIKERPQRLGINVDDDTVEQSPVRFGNQRLDRRRDERRERIMQIREQERLERQRRRLMQKERFFIGGHHSTGLDDVASALTDLLVGGGHGGGVFGGHGHHHGQQGIFGKPHKRPLKPMKPSKPHKPQKPSHNGGNNGISFGGNEGYEVHEQINESPIHSSGIFSWLQTTDQSQYPKIQNKIAPGSEFPNDRDIAEFRAL